MRLGFRGKIFFATFAISAVSLALAGTFVSYSIARQTTARIEQSLTAEARLVADVLSRQERNVAVSDLDAESHRIGATMAARVTFIGPDGVVLGDSMVSGPHLHALENHATRPEVIEAARSGTGASRRHSGTLNTDMMYVAVRVNHPAVATVRLALPLTEVQEQAGIIRRGTFYVLAFALFGAAIAAGLTSLLLGRRLNDLAVAARRYAAGDLSRPVRDYGADELGTVARALDGIVRELAERASELATDRARIDAILAGMVEGVVVVNPQGKVQLVNRAARDMLALTGPAAGHYLESVRHPGVAGLLGAALNGEQPAGLEIAPERSPDRRLIARAAPVSAPGGNGAVLVLHDITDLRRLDQVRRDFVANVSHELRTPLTAIRGYIEALADDPVTPEERTRFLEVIARHASRMERLVRDLLRLASLDAKQEAVERCECPVQGLLTGTVTDLAPRIEARRQRVEIHVDPAVATIVTDAAKLQDVLRNLVENAVNYSPEGRLVRLEATARDGQAILTVADDGPGIPEADLQRIFERFYRVDKARSRESGGTGLGLSIVKHLVELLGGRVWAANRPEGGAIFTVTLPMK
jgi:two-component system, OmpR family, phosphate regulon sensor histidine kinase PhoR